MMKVGPFICLLLLCAAAVTGIYWSNHTTHLSSHQAPMSIKSNVEKTKTQNISGENEESHHSKDSSWFSKFDEDPIEFFTLLLAISTILLWLDTRGLRKLGLKQSKDMEKSLAIAEKSVAIAEKSLTVAERAYVFFAKVSVPGFTFPGDGKSVAFNANGLTYILANHGKTPAILTEIYTIHALMPHEGEFKLPPPIDIDPKFRELLPSGISLASGQSSEYNHDILQASIELLSVAKRQKFLFFMGYVRYCDIFNKKHITGFCSIYNESSAEFIAIGGDGYNYTKDED